MYWSLCTVRKNNGTQILQNGHVVVYMCRSAKIKNTQLVHRKLVAQYCALCIYVLDSGQACFVPVIGNVREGFHMSWKIRPKYIPFGKTVFSN